MSYLHCPTCKCAYNLAREPVCPRCGIRPGTGDPVDDVVAAAEQLARAIDRAQPADLAAADARLAQRALPAPAIGSSPAARPSLMFAREAVRAALGPRPATETGANRALLATIAVALLTRLAAPRRTPVRWARSLFRAVSGSAY